MNFLGISAGALGFGLFCLTVRAVTKRPEHPIPIWFWFLSSVLALPAFSFAFYYTHLIGEPLWLYTLRALPGSEFLGVFAGIMAGLVQARGVPRMHLSPIGKKALIPAVLLIGLWLPYLKPVFRPLQAATLQDSWTEGVCLQSTPATCGPASLATILRHLGKSSTEQALALEAFSCASGTENWYLARAIKRRGLEPSFLSGTPLTVPLPAIAGVKLLSAEGAGHFIAVLGRTNDMLLIADPLEGRQVASLQQLAEKYQFTGFFLTISPNP